MKPGPPSLVWDVIGTVIWIWIIVNECVVNLERLIVEALPISATFFSMKLPLLIAFAALSSLVLGRRGIWFLLYVACFPVVVVLWKIPKRMYLNWPIVFAFLPAAYDAFRAFRRTFAMHAIGFISAFVIWKSQNSIAVVTSMILLGAYIAATLTKALWKAYAATVFHGLTAFVSQMRQKIESGEWDCHFAATVADNNGANPEKIETDRHGKMQLLYITNFGFGFAADRVYEVARSRKVDLYLMLTVFFAAFQIIVGFAVEFLGLNFVNASSFSDAEGATFFDFLGFSLSVFSTVEVSPIAAVTQWARLLCYLEVGCLML